MPETPTIEQQALAAILANNLREAERLVLQLTASEKDLLLDACDELAAMIDRVGGDRR